MFQPVAQVTGLIADIALTGDIVRPLLLADRLQIKVDLFIATYSEDVELVRLSIRDAMRMTYPGPLGAGYRPYSRYCSDG
jgi:hypothetical protein